MKKLLFTLFTCLPLFLLAQTAKPGGRQLFDKKTLADIRITLPQKNWPDLLDSMRLYGNGMLTGTATIDGKKYENVGVRYRGNNSYQKGVKRNPYQIKLDYVTPEQNHQGYTNIKLSSALRDPSLVREVLYSEIAGKYIPMPQAGYAKLYINGEYIGLFVNLEPVEGKFLTEHFGSDKGMLFKAGLDYKKDAPQGCKQNIVGSLEYEENLDCYQSNFEMLSDRGWAELQELTKALNTGELRNVEHMLDIDRTLWMLALNNVMVNLSSYTGATSTNYYLYKDDNGHFQFIPWDLNLAFGSYKNIAAGSSDLEIKELQKLDPLLHSDNPYKPLISKLLADSYYRKIYLSHIRQILAENFKNGAYEKRAKELQGMIVVPLSDDKYKAYSLDEFQHSLSQTIGKKSKIPGIVEFMSARVAFLKENPELTVVSPEISDVNVLSRQKFEKARVDTFHIMAKANLYPKRMLIYYRFADTEPYMMMTMTEEASKDLKAGVKQFSAAVPPPPGNTEPTLDYFLVAENAGTVAFSPNTYMGKANKIALSDLNK